MHFSKSSKLILLATVATALTLPQGTPSTAATADITSNTPPPQSSGEGLEDTSLATSATCHIIRDEIFTSSDYYSSLNGALFESLSSIENAVYSVFEEEYIEQLTESLTDIFVSYFSELPTPSQTSLQPSITSIYALLYEITYGSEPVINGVTVTDSDLFDEFIDTDYTDSYDDYYETATESYDDYYETATDYYDDYYETATDYYDDYYDSVTESYDDYYDSVTESYDDYYDSVTESYDDYYDSVTESYDDYYDSVTESYDDYYDSVTSTGSYDGYYNYEEYATVTDYQGSATNTNVSDNA